MNRDFAREYYDPVRVGRPSSRNNRNIGLGSTYRSPQSHTNSQRPISRSSSVRSSSRSTQTSHNIQLLLSDGEVFPQQVLLLLGDQERNLVSFKNRIQNEKVKVDTDFSNMKQEICHIIDDLKISVQAQLDNIYRLFMQKYACLKTEVQDIRRIKKQMQWQSSPQSIAATSFSNRQLIKELQKDSANYKAYKIHNYITEIQKKKLSPLLDLTRQIVLLGTTNSNFYKSDVTVKQLTELKGSFGHFTSHMFSALGNYVAGPQTILETMFEKDNDNNNTFAAVERRDDDFVYPTRDTPDLPRSMTTPVPAVTCSANLASINRPPAYSEYTPNHNPYPSSPRLNQYQLFPPTQPGFSKPSYSVNATTPQSITPGYSNYPIGGNNYSSGTNNYSSSGNIRLAGSGQSLASSWIQDLKVTESKTVYTDHQGMVLCAAIIKNQYIATGGKDSLIHVYNLDGTKIATLRGHSASICTIGVLNPKDSKPILVSGGDSKCNSIVFWDTNTWTIRSKIQVHSAAVTALADCCDGQTLISGSFDKKINVINYNRAEVVFNLPINKQPVMGIVINSTKTKMISASIMQNQSSSLSIWNIVRKSQIGTVEMVSLQRVIPSGSRVWSIISSQIRSSLVVTGSTDGKIKLWNIDTGQCQKALTANNNAIVQLGLVQRDSKPNFPLILSCSSKDKSLVLTRTQTSLNSLFQVNNRLNIHLGGGVSPKLLFDKYKGVPIMALVSQGQQRRQVSLFNVQLK